MQNNVETQHKHMYSLYIDSLCNIAFPMACITCIVTLIICEKLNSAFIGAEKTLIYELFFIFKARKGEVVVKKTSTCICVINNKKVYFDCTCTYYVMD